MCENLFSAFCDGDINRQELVRTWLSHLLCDSPRRLIDSVLLCHHSRDEQKVTKLKQSLQELGPVTVHSRDERSLAESGGFSEDLVIFCLSVEYVQSSEQFVRDVNTLMEGENEVTYFMMEDNFKELKKDLNSRGITKETVFFFEEPDVPSIFKIYKRKKKESSKTKTVYVSSCSDASSEMERLSTMMSSITTLNYIVPKKRRSFANMTKEDWNLTSNQLTSSDEYLLLLSNGYFNDDICLLECELIRRRGKKIHVIDVRSHSRNTDPAWLQTLHTIKYDYDDDVMTVLVSYLLEEQQECNSIIISFHPSEYINAEECRKIFQSSPSQYKVCLTTDFPESKKLYQKIMKCQAVVLCVSKAFMADKKCRREAEIAHMMWKKLIPINLYADTVDMEHAKWLIKIIGHSQFVHQKKLEDFLKQNVLLNDNLKLENWIQRNITVPLHSKIATQIERCRSCRGVPEHTVTDAFGKVKVLAEGGLERRAAMYVRLSTKSDLKTVASLIIDQWKLAQPRLLISVTGEGSQIIKNPKKCRVITNALQNIVKEKGVWFTTDGATSEISEVIGKVVEKDVNERPIVIGIASWKYLRMNEHLVTKYGCGRWPVTYNTREALKAIGEYHLNPFCSHFLLTHKCAVVSDSGDCCVISTANFRAEFEEYIRQGKYNIQASCCPEPIPSLLLLVGGDQRQSLSMVKRSLDAKRPVVVLRGTGGFADTLAYALKTGRSEESRISVILDHPEREIIKCVNLNDDHCGLGQTILDVLLNSISDDEQKLSLALGFNNSEKAKEHVFFDNRKTQHLEDSFMAELMLKAMREGKIDFVRLLISECIDIQKFQLNNRDKLYASKYLPDELRRQLVLLDFDPSIDCIRRFVVRNITMDVFVENNIPEEMKDKYADDPYFYLMVWSILMMNLHELSLFFCQHCEEPLPSALIASGIIRKLRKGCQVTNKILADKLLKQEKEFIKLSCGVLQEFFESNPEETERLLIRERPRWNNLNLLDIAFRLKHRPFMSHEACKIPINKIWFGRISPENNSFWMTISVFFLGLFPFVLKFIEEPRDTSCDQDKNQTGCCRNYWHKMRDRIKGFYTAPIMRFSHTMASYLLFLSLFSYTMLTGFSEHTHWRVLLVYSWVFTLILDQIREFLNAIEENKTYFGQKYAREHPSVLRVYFRDRWNYFDVTILCFFVIAVALSFVPSYTAEEFARVFHAISLVAFFMRILKTFSAIEELGPKLWMISAMAKDLMYFVIILMVFVVSYAIAAYSVIYPDSKLDLDVVFSVLRLGYWNLYGELLLEDLEAEEPACSFDPAVYENGTLPRCAVKHRRLVGFTMMGIYLLFANVMLLNILIAMFSETYQRIKTQRNQKWNYERYGLVKEFQRVPVIPMPLGAAIYIIDTLRWMYSKLKKKPISVDHAKRDLIGKDLIKNEVLTDLERECFYMFMKKKQEENDASTPMTSVDVSNIVNEQLNQRLSRMQSLTNIQILSPLPARNKLTALN